MFYLKNLVRFIKEISFFKFVIESVYNINSLQNEKFRNSSYTDRVKKIMQLHNFKLKNQLLEGLNYKNKSYFENNINFHNKVVNDLILSLTKVKKPKCFMQLGSWYMGEISTLKIFGFRGKLIASDFSDEFIKIIRDKTVDTFLSDIEFRRVNLEDCCNKDFSEVEMLSAVQVFSNIQPEGIEKFFNLLPKTDVKTLIICDIYSAESLRENKSVLLKTKLNWCHPFIDLAKKNNLGIYMIPEFTFDTYTESRAIFVVYKKNSLNSHKRALGIAYERIIDRSDQIKW